MLEITELRKLSSKLVAEPDNYMHSFRKNLDVYIDRKEITLAELAELSDIPLNTLKSLVYGTSTDCHISTAVKLAKALHISVDELIGSGTISPQTCESLQLVRMMPESFTHFVRWAIRYHYDMLTTNKVSIKSVELMLPDVSESGSVIMTNDFDVIDISYVSDDLRLKIFMGIRIPCNNYAPIYFEGDVVFVANDREPRENENVVVAISGILWILKMKREIVDGREVVNYYSIRDGRVFATEGESVFKIGYIVKLSRYIAG